MSYILDALRRADAERERGAVPGIHAQRFAPDDPSDAESPARVRPVVWLAAGALVCVLLGGAVVWQLLQSGDEAPTSRPRALQGAVTDGAAAPAVPVATPAPAPTPSASTAAGPVAAPASPTPAAAARAAAPAPSPKPATTQRASPRTAAADRAPTAPEPVAKPPVVADAPPASPRRKPPAGNADPATPESTGSTQRSAARPAPSPAAPAPARAGEPVPPRIYARGELPEEIRRQLPELSIGGSIYSQDRANRFLIINGQVFHEGSQPMPGLVLEQIGLKSAVLSFKDYRYSISY